MIKCENLSKKYGEQTVFCDFNYTFFDRGFYLLFGESGCGKTTLLNMLAHMIEADGGTISISDTDDSLSFMRENSDYITQDAFFVDFLTVMDNLKLINDDEDVINGFLSDFGLTDKCKSYPDTLSGGEKQRIALVRALIGGKRILLLDEPTAALDYENKVNIFKLLGELKKDVLIICSSHDFMAKQYADYILDFSGEKESFKSGNAHIDEADGKADWVMSSPVNHINKKPIKYFLKQWFKSVKRHDKSRLLFGVFITIGLCMCMLADTPRHRNESYLDNVYKVNSLTLHTYEKDEKIYESLLNDDRVSEVVLDYGESVPLTQHETDSGVWVIDEEYEDSVFVLPFDEGSFKLSDKIKYGSYFTDKNQVLLSNELVEILYPYYADEPEKLIGKTLTKNLYGVGEVELSIAGIFDSFDDKENIYFYSMGYFLNGDEWFINSEFTRQYVHDNDFYGNGKQRAYKLFFDSYKSMKKYYDDNFESFRDAGSYLEIYSIKGKKEELFSLLYRVFLPLSYFLAFFTIAFYLRLTKTELTYNNKFISVFHYAGYDVGKVVKSFMMLKLIDLLKVFAVSGICSFLLTAFINVVNDKIMFIEFQLFLYNRKMIFVFLLFLLLAAVIFVYAFMKRYTRITWYENIIKNRDLI